MFQYILLLLLLSASYRSFGNPINPTVPVSLANSLTELAGHCENAFLTKQIKSKILYCSDLSSPHDEKQLQCLIFYDINKQLCAAVSEAKIALPEEDYSAKINEKQDLNSLCLSTKDWVFSNLTEFSRYKQAVDMIFKRPVTCGKICGVENLYNDEANFFCKYFKWGTEIMKQQVTVSSTQENAIKNAQLSPQAANVDNKVVSAPSSSELQDVQIKSNSSSDLKFNAPTSNVSVLNKDVAKVDLVNAVTSSLPVNQNSQSSEPDSLVNVAAVPEKPDNADTNVDNIEDTGAMPESVLNAVDQPSKSPEDIIPKAETVQEAASKPEIPEATQNKPKDAHKTDVDKELQLLNTELENKQSVLENPQVKPPNEVEDYQDSDEGKGFGDMQGGDDADDPDDLDTKPENQQLAKKDDTILATFTGEKETFYANPVQDAFPEDEDHFFPFFLTAVILVVLLYVLYHNKNKVGKMFFGLVLEGRQATRRRNSRGHAYRRLDTLEQAMSANTAAPPSKIIY